MSLHAGYENRVEDVLRETLGNDYSTRDVSYTSFAPWIDMVNDRTGAIEHQRIDRVAFVLEGERENVRRALEDMLVGLK